MKKYALIALATMYTVFAIVACTQVPAIEAVDGEIKLNPDRMVNLWAFTDDGKDYARTLMKSRGYIYEPRKDNFWLDLTLGIGIALGGVLVAGGIILAVFTKGIYLKKGITAAGAGILMIATFYFLMEYLKLLAIGVGVCLLIALAFGIWYVIHNRNALFKMVETTELAKRLDPDLIETPTSKQMLRDVQGKYQPILKKYHDTRIKL